MPHKALNLVQCCAAALAAMVASATLVRAEDARSMTLGPATIARVEAQLHRGVSTKADVRKLLGPPAGLGDAELPGDSVRRGIWYYGHLEATGSLIDLRLLAVATNTQRTLLVFFEGDIYSGYLWISYPAAP